LWQKTVPLDSKKPVNGSLISAAELRGQFNGLKALLDAIPAGPPGEVSSQQLTDARR
jgi:hypothetical protein